MTIYLETRDDARQVQALVATAIEREIAHLELAYALAMQRLRPFEQRYAVTSAEFAATMAAEDLVGGDDEDVQWAGEYALAQQLMVQLRQLRGVSYRDQAIH
jgi:hypothetical protein